MALKNQPRRTPREIAFSGMSDKEIDAFWHSIALDVDPSEFSNMLETELEEHVRDVLNQLTDQERTALRLTFGLDDGKPKSPEKVAQEMVLPTPKVRKTIKSGLDKLAHPAK